MESSLKTASTGCVCASAVLNSQAYVVPVNNCLHNGVTVDVQVYQSLRNLQVLYNKLVSNKMYLL
jgi:hypothetical protein